MRTAPLFSVVGILLTVLFCAHIAFAESVVWNTAEQISLCPVEEETAGKCARVDALRDFSVNITYRTQVERLDASGNTTGEIIACGSSVAKGTRLKFSIVPHTYTDINWFGTGHSYDTPYGDWKVNAAPPAPICAEKDFFGFTETTSRWLYSPLSVDQPNTSIENLSGLACSSVTDTQATCTADTLGSVSPQFSFASTFGKFYWRYREGAETAQCQWIEPDLALHEVTGESGGRVNAKENAYMLNVPQQVIPCPITVIDQCSDTAEEDDGGSSGSANDKPFYWLDTAPKVGGYSQNAHVGNDVTQPLDGDTTSITAMMFCRVGMNGGRMDQSQFWVKDKNGANIFSSDTISCKDATDRYFTQPSGCNVTAPGHCYESTYEIALPPSGAPYSVRTTGAGANGWAPDQYIFDAYLGITEHKNAASGENNASSGDNSNSCIPSGPTEPSISAGGAAQCVIGQPYTIQMQSEDPNGDTIRYLIDWNGDGDTDQFFPAVGYVPSGTSQTASRTYATTGAKSVKVRTQDSTGALSGWASFSFTCATSATEGLNGNNGGLGGEGGPVVPDLTIRAIPSLVRTGNTTKVNWSATGVASCTVTAPNGDSWNTLQSILGGNVSSPITAETTYTLSCLDAQNGVHTKTATVKVIPRFQEK